MMVSNQCWSDYYTASLYHQIPGITPAGMINFVSNCSGSRASDKCITINSGFLDLIEPHDSVLADKGFISLIEELTLHHANLLVPPGRHGIAHMTASDVQKTKEIANRRIYVEQAVRRFKFFRLMKFEVPVTVCQHLHDILKIVLAYTIFIHLFLGMIEKKMMRNLFPFKNNYQVYSNMHFKIL